MGLFSDLGNVLGSTVASSVGNAIGGVAGGIIGGLLGALGGWGASYEFSEHYTRGALPNAQVFGMQNVTSIVDNNLVAAPIHSDNSTQESNKYKRIKYVHKGDHNIWTYNQPSDLSNWTKVTETDVHGIDNDKIINKVDPNIIFPNAKFPMDGGDSGNGSSGGDNSGGAGGADDKSNFTGIPSTYEWPYIVDDVEDRIGKSFPVKIPNWGYDDFINERNIWVKGLTSPYGEPGYFYFKIFFDFDSYDGLLGGILNVMHPSHARNTAAKFFDRMHRAGAYLSERPGDRKIAIEKFVRLLSYINCNAPWFFKGIIGLNEANKPLVNEFSKERFIEIQTNPDAIDMRLSTLMDLYKFAVYDDVTGRELLPDNLRKFDMYILIYNSPIKKLHTAWQAPGFKSRGFLSSFFSSFVDSIGLSGGLTGSSSAGPVFGYRSTSPNQADEPMSFKLFAFQNCEFMIDSLSNLTPGTITNETPFQLGLGNIKIKYDKVLTYLSNEFNSMLFGSSGFYYNKYSIFDYNIATQHTGRINDVKDARVGLTKSSTPIMNPMRQNSVEAAELIAHNNLFELSGLSLGNIYGQDTRVGTSYYKDKLKYLSYRPKRFSRLLDGMRSQDNAFLPGYHTYAIGSQKWKEKLDKLKGDKQTIVSRYGTDYEQTNNIDTLGKKVSNASRFTAKVESLSAPGRGKRNRSTVDINGNRIYAYKDNDIKKLENGQSVNSKLSWNQDKIAPSDYDNTNNISNKSLLTQKLQMWKKDGSLSGVRSHIKYRDANNDRHKTIIDGDGNISPLRYGTDYDKANNISNSSLLQGMLDKADGNKEKLVSIYGTDYDSGKNISNESLLEKKLDKWKGNK